MASPSRVSLHVLRPLIRVVAISTRGRVTNYASEEGPVPLGVPCWEAFSEMGARCVDCPWAPGHLEPKGTETVICQPLEGSGDVWLHVVLRPETEQLLVDLLRRLDELSHDSARTSFLVHELSNVITALEGAAESLLAREDLPLDARDDALEIYRYADACRELLVRYKTGRSRLSRPQQVAVALNLVHQAVRMCQPALVETGAQIDVSGPGDRVYVRADTTEARQILTNLLLNAIQAAAQGPRPPRIQVEIRTEPEHVVVCVQDNGPGIPEDIREQIFEMFFTTKPTGTGLGLALAQALATKNQARIEFETCGEGTTFKVWFRRAKQ